MEIEQLEFRQRNLNNTVEFPTLYTTFRDVESNQFYVASCYTRVKQHNSP